MLFSDDAFIAESSTFDDLFKLDADLAKRDRLAVCARYIAGFACVPMVEVMSQMRVAAPPRAYDAALEYATSNEPHNSDYSDDDDLQQGTVECSL